MIYVYCVLISWASCLSFLAALILFGRWALPRYGMRIMASAVQPPHFGPVSSSANVNVTPPHVKVAPLRHKNN